MMDTMYLEQDLQLHKFFDDHMIHKGKKHTMKEMCGTLGAVKADPGWKVSFMHLWELKFDEFESFCIRYVYPRF